MSLTTIDETDVQRAIPFGRPTKYTRKLAAAICDRLAAGQSLRTVCRDEDMPDRETVRRWINERNDFRGQYRTARIDQAEHLGDEMMDIADDGSNDYVERERSDGTKYTAFDAEHVQRSKLRVNTRQWYLSRVLPKVYGDRQVVEHTGDVNMTIKSASEDELRARLAVLQARVAARVTDVEDEATEADPADDKA